jgi:AraC-like DNA-binding protein
MSANSQRLSSRFDYAPGHEVRDHSHDRHQLTYAGRGALIVRSRNQIWVVPPLHALWIPARVRHSITVRGPAQMHAVYLDVSVETDRAASEICNVTASNLLRALIEHLSTTVPVESVPLARLKSVLVDQLQFSNAKPLQLPIFNDDRLLKISKAFMTDPSDNRTLAEWGRTVGASERTLSRAFHHESQNTFGRWRTNVRMVKAVELLAERLDVNTVATACGYETTSAFIQAFKLAHATTPGTYFSPSRN